MFYLFENVKQIKHWRDVLEYPDFDMNKRQSAFASDTVSGLK